MLVALVLGYLIYFVFGAVVGFMFAFGLLTFAWMFNRDGVVNNIDEVIENYNNRTDNDSQ